MNKSAFITGITGQDGAYLAKLLLEKGYSVFGGYHSSSMADLWRLEALNIKEHIKLINIDLLDGNSLSGALKESQPHEIYNLGAQSFVGTSFEKASFTGDVSGLGVARLYESIKKYNSEIKIFQASSSEIFGNAFETPQRETTSFHPRNPYGTAKLYGHFINDNFRDHYNLFGCCGILYNHESPLRGIEFVTKKITSSIAQIKKGTLEYFDIGNINAQRDWGFAGDYVDAMYLMLQQSQPDDYIIATGKTHSVRQFIETSFEAVNIPFEWSGSGIEEIGINSKTGKTIVKVNPQFYRPDESHIMTGDATKAREKLNWQPKVSFEKLIEMMIEFDMN